MAMEGNIEASEETFWEYIDEIPEFSSEDVMAWVDYVDVLLDQEDYDRGFKLGLAFLDNIDVDSQPVIDRMYQLLADGARRKRDEDVLISILKKADSELPADSFGRGAVLSRFAPRQIDSWEVDDPEVAPVLANYGHRHAAKGNVHTAFGAWLGVSNDPTGVPSMDMPIVSSYMFVSALRVAEVDDFDNYGSPDTPPSSTLKRLREKGIVDDLPGYLQSVHQAAMGKSPTMDPAAIRAQADVTPEEIPTPVEGVQPTDQDVARRLAAAEVLERIRRA
jgi:hypothetical protein